MGNSPAVPQKVNSELPFDPANPLLGIHPREWKHVYTKTCRLPLIPALFIIAEKWEQPKCPSVDDKLCDTAVHRDIQPQWSTDTCYHTMNPEHLVLKERSQFHESRIVWFHLYELSWVCESLKEISGCWEVVEGWGRGVAAHGQRISFWVMKMV